MFLCSKKDEGVYIPWEKIKYVAIKAAYKYADDKKKIKEVKDYLVSSYEDIMRNVSKTEIIHA